MKTPIVDFIDYPGLGTVFPNFVRGSLSLALMILAGYLIFHFAGEAYQLDSDGEIGIGQVQNTVKWKTRRSIGYELDVLTSHGMLTLSSDSRIAPGDHVRYIFSPSSKIAKLAAEPIQRGDMLWAYCRSIEAIGLAIGFLLFAYYAYNQYRWIYIFVSGRYTVKGKPVGEPDVRRTTGSSLSR
ncbi:MAG: hypothetical protein ABIK28_25655 [Planctomycetota bacterium]